MPASRSLRAGLQHGAKTSQGHVAIEGEHLLREAVRSGLRLHAVFVRDGSEEILEKTGVGSAEVLFVSPDVFTSAVTTEHPQGVAALIEPPQFQVDQMLRGVPLVVIAAGLQDPGNLGTLVRSAEAFGATGMILFPGTVSLWNAKVLRASSGSAFRLPAVSLAAGEAFAALRAAGVRLLAASPRGGAPPGSTGENLAEPVALMLGNEGAGLPKDWLSQADACITLSCPGAVESLNAAVAGSILLYEAARQRAARVRA